MPVKPMGLAHMRIFKGQEESRNDKTEIYAEFS